MALKEEAVWVMVLTHFSGALSEIIGVFSDLNQAKEVQKQYDTLNRVSVDIYRAPMLRPIAKKKKSDVANG